MAEARQRALLRFRLVPLAVSALAERRIDARPLLARFGVSEAPLGEPIYVSLAKVTAFLDECAKLAGDPVFGWNLAKRAPLGVYGLVEFAMRSAGTLREGFEAVRRYGALINGLFEFEIDEAGDELGFGFTIHGVRPGEYKIYAWEIVEPGAYQDPDFIKPYESAGEAVSIKESARETVQLKLIPTQQ